VCCVEVFVIQGRLDAVVQRADYALPKGAADFAGREPGLLSGPKTNRIPGGVSKAGPFARDSFR
jgi:hypothetical protein